MEPLVLGIEGMSCGGCVASVERAIGRVAGVRAVRVSLDRREAVVEGEGVDPAKVRAAVTDAGYEVR